MTHYEILGVTQDAPYAAIKRNYRALVKQYHPDLNPSEEARELIIKITEAYSVLSDVAKREAYDRVLAGYAPVVEEPVHQPDERELYRRAYVKRKREKEEQNWRRLFEMKVAFYRMQRKLALVFMLVALVFSYDYFFTEIRTECDVVRVYDGPYGEGRVACDKIGFKISDGAIVNELLSTPFATVKVHYSRFYDEPVGVSTPLGNYYNISGSLHTLKNFFPTLLCFLSLLLLIYHEYNDVLLTLGLLQFFVALFLILQHLAFVMV